MTAAAAAAIKLEQDEEEELMTGEGAQTGWEYKIIRSATGRFKDCATKRCPAG